LLLKIYPQSFFLGPGKTDPEPLGGSWPRARLQSSDFKSPLPNLNPLGIVHIGIA